MCLNCCSNSLVLSCLPLTSWATFQNWFFLMTIMCLFSWYGNFTLVSAGFLGTRQQLNMCSYELMAMGSFFIYSGSRLHSSTIFLNSSTAVVMAAARLAGFLLFLSSRCE